MSIKTDDSVTVNIELVQRASLTQSDPRDAMLTDSMGGEFPSRAMLTESKKQGNTNSMSSELKENS